MHRQSKTLTAPRFAHDTLGALPVIFYIHKLTPYGLEPQWISPSVQPLLGHCIEDVLTPSWWGAHIHPDDINRVFSNYQSLTLHRHIRHEYRVLRKDGKFVRVSDDAWMICREDGEPIQVLGASTVDLNSVPEKRGSGVQEQARLSEELLNAIPNPIFFKDREGRYLGCNTAFEAYLGLGREAIVGRSVYDIAPSDLADIYHKADETLFESGGVQVYETSVLAADGFRKDVVFNKAIFKRADGTPAGLVGVIVDVTERNQLEERWHVLAQVLERSSQAVVVVDEKQGIVFANNAYSMRTGFTAEDWHERTIPFTPWGRYDKGYYSRLWEAAIDIGTWHGLVCIRRRNGERAEEVVTISAIAGGRTGSYFSVVFNYANERSETSVSRSSTRKQPETAVAPKIRRYAPEHDIVGSSTVMKRMFSAIRKLAGVEAPVLITGESGTGKEKAAMAIHRCGKRAARPFVAINCGSLPPSLIQSELFGYERGAFTGALQRKVGRIEAASSGTLFLDEVGDLPIELQVVLLRFLQEKTIDRVGGGEHVEVDVRVIAATHKNLEKAVHEGHFREDLYYRLNVLHLHVPPLRDRDNDIELIAQHCWQQFAHEKSSRAEGFSAEALSIMNNHSWPGNVRELINRVRRAMIMTDKRLICPADMGLERRIARQTGTTLEQAREASEKQAVQLALQQAKGNVSLTAKRLGVSRVCLYRLIKKYEIPAL